MRSAHRLNLSAIIAAAVLLAVMASCASTKHVPQGKLLLDRVRIDVEDPSKQVNTKDLYNYLRQNENHRVLGGLKLQLAQLRFGLDGGQRPPAAHGLEQPRLHEK